MFAGVPGSSKSPVAHHLGWNLGLPIFNNDTLRTEIAEDSGEVELGRYEALRDARLEQLLALNHSFIYDASVDRQWLNAKKWLDDHDYEHFVINMDLDRSFIEKIYKAKGYTQVDKLDGWFDDHEKFNNSHADIVNVRIGTEDFSNRLDIALNAVNNWINT